jgi:hypothetical protein
MMLGYVHNTTKIWRIWDFNSGKTGRAVECSSVVFDEQEDAFTSSTGERAEAVEFPDQTEEQSQSKVDEMTFERTDNSLDMQDSSSKSKSPKSCRLLIILRCHSLFAGGEINCSRLMNGRGSRCHSLFAGGR